MSAAAAAAAANKGLVEGSPTAGASTSGREGCPPSSGTGEGLQFQQQYPVSLQQQLAAQGIPHGYPGMVEGGPVDPTQAQVAAFANQTAMYGPYGSPYSLAMAPPPTGGPYFPGMGAQLPFTSLDTFTLPGPAYYDPYGMINPAACVAPVPPPENREVEQPKHLRRKASKKWFGCC
ncbi:hypothetical protein, conserved [Eimeria tenella]|uniref:Uncharacterized protein n=1 Tax=Eimeria tenella TaxID=5802 RepID=U6KYC6_EIMTE|nr:hypothetical protein, conserved [Eimeria tenella]CDJ43187.1 hypothetical protein, conserved [Eimeria tenella]|eukprot:XP_013233937.1 hypothetical protein, conserved [Eimeria tenella]